MNQASNAGPRTLGDAISGVTVPAAAMAVGFVVCIVGSVAPWATSPLSSVPGTNGDGKISIVLAVVGLLVLLRGASRAWAMLGVLSVALVALGIYEAVHIHHQLAGVTLYGQQIDHVGWGVYAVIAGAVIAFLGSLQAARR